MSTPDCPLDAGTDYIGMEFSSTLWEDVCRSCIVPPDAAFRISEKGTWEEADGQPIPTPEDCEGETIFLLWRMDEEERSPLRRPRLHTILAAFAQLYSRYVGKRGCVQMLVVRSHGRQEHVSSELPAINFQLWQQAFWFVFGPFSFREYEMDEFVTSLPAPEPPMEASFCAAARKEWVRLTTERVEYLLSCIHDARSYEMHLPVLEEWFNYLAQMSAHSLNISEEMDRLRFRPWYAEVLRRMPGLNRKGLCIVGLESLGRFALLDYRPEEGRRFRYEAESDEGPMARGHLYPAQPGEESLPYDARWHLHLLPVPYERLKNGLFIRGVAYSAFFRETWLEEELR